MAKKYDRIYIEVSNICNFSCPFCSSIARESREMSDKEIARVISEIKDYTDEVCLHVLGEPLLYSKLDLALALCAAADIKVNLVTNGYYIASRLPLLVSYAQTIKKVSFSIHSYVYNNIDIATKMADIMTAAKQLADCGVSVELRNLNGNKSDLLERSIKDNILKCGGASIADFNRTCKIVDRLYYVVKPPFIWPDRSRGCNANVVANNKRYCLGGSSHIAVLSNLTVVPCCLDAAGEIELGSLKTHSLHEILNSPEYTALTQAFKSGKPAHLLCATCQYASR